MLDQSFARPQTSGRLTSPHTLRATTCPQPKSLKRVIVTPAKVKSSTLCSNDQGHINEKIYTTLPLNQAQEFYQKNMPCAGTSALSINTPGMFITSNLSQQGSVSEEGSNMTRKPSCCFPEAAFVLCRLRNHWHVGTTIWRYKGILRTSVKNSTWPF